MNKSFFTYLLMFLVLVVVQALLFNHIILFNSAVCFIFIYFVIKLPLGMATNALLSLGFAIGLSIDILSDTPGLNALSATVLASLKRPVFFAYAQHDDHIRNIAPGVASMGWLDFCKYVLSMSALYSLFAVSVEFAPFASLLDIIAKIAASTAFTFFMIIAIDSLFYNNK